MFQVQTWDHAAQRHVPVDEGGFDAFEPGVEFLDDLPCRAGARIVDLRVAPGEPGHVVVELPVFEVAWVSGVAPLVGLTSDYQKVAAYFGLPLDEYMQDDEPTPVYGVENDVIGWMNAP